MKRLITICICCLSVCFTSSLEAKNRNNYHTFKQNIARTYHFNYGADLSFMLQTAVTEKSKTSLQSIFSPYFSWQLPQQHYGISTINFAYNIVHYHGSASGDKLGRNLATLTSVNDYGSSVTSFDELYYTFTPHTNSSLTLALGQFPLYNFDGSTYNSNQQLHFINESLSQNQTSAYAVSGLGTYLSYNLSPQWNIALGLQDASDINAPSIRFNHLSDNHYTTFGYVSYSPINFLGSAQYSLLAYNQPATAEQSQTVNGLSFNLSQDIGQHWNLFARYNLATSHLLSINRSAVLGAVLKDPLQRSNFDEFGLALVYNHIDKKAAEVPVFHNYETILETYLALSVNPNLIITPDIQLYINPAQNPASTYDAVFSLRTTFLF